MQVSKTEQYWDLRLNRHQLNICFHAISRFCLFFFPPRTPHRITISRVGRDPYGSKNPTPSLTNPRGALLQCAIQFMQWGEKGWWSQGPLNTDCSPVQHLAQTLTCGPNQIRDDSKNYKKLQLGMCFAVSHGQWDIFFFFSCRSEITFWCNYGLKEEKKCLRYQLHSSSTPSFPFSFQRELNPFKVKC